MPNITGNETEQNRARAAARERRFGGSTQIATQTLNKTVEGAKGVPKKLYDSGGVAAYKGKGSRTARPH
jgi:hypothetical protein